MLCSFRVCFLFCFVFFFFSHSYPKIITCIYFFKKKKKKGCFMSFITAFLSEISAEEFCAPQASAAIQSQKAGAQGEQSSDLCEGEVS